MQPNFQPFLEDPKAKESILKKNIFYDALEITQIEDTAEITSDGILGIIGGYFGSFLGKFKILHSTNFYIFIVYLRDQSSKFCRNF